MKGFHGLLLVGTKIGFKNTQIGSTSMKRYLKRYLTNPKITKIGSIQKYKVLQNNQLGF